MLDIFQKTVSDRVDDFLSSLSERFASAGYNISVEKEYLRGGKLSFDELGVAVIAREFRCKYGGPFQLSNRLHYKITVPQGIRCKPRFKPVVYPEPKNGFDIDKAVERVLPVVEAVKLAVDKIKADDLAWRTFYEAYFGRPPRGPAAEIHKAVCDSALRMVSIGDKVRISFVCPSDQEGAEIARGISCELAKNGMVTEDD